MKANEYHEKIITPKSENPDFSPSEWLCIRFCDEYEVIRQQRCAKVRDSKIAIGKELIQKYNKVARLCAKDNIILPEISQSESEALLCKYGKLPAQQSNDEILSQIDSNDFGEMMMMRLLSRIKLRPMVNIDINSIDDIELELNEIKFAEDIYEIMGLLPYAGPLREEKGQLMEQLNILKNNQRVEDENIETIPPKPVSLLTKIIHMMKKFKRSEKNENTDKEN